VSDISRIVVAEARVPFVRDGAQLHSQALCEQLRARGYDAETVALPFEPEKSAVLAQAAAWRLLNMSTSNTRPVDVLIATRFPTYFVRHPRKVAWLMHQHRPAYELYGTAYSDFTSSDDDVRLRERLIALDSHMLGECTRIFTNAQNTANRLATFNGLTGKPLYHPPPLAGRLHAGPYENYVLAVARLEPLKRVDLAVRAMAHVTLPLRLVVVGEGSQRTTLERAAADSGVGDRIEFVGAVWADQTARWYANALAVVYTPFDEDFGYVTLEAFLAARPVITSRDSGGPLEFVRDGENGMVLDPDPKAIAAAINTLAADRAAAERFGAAGRARARMITWDGIIEQLLG
jgi:glycosyltransferase involved in cell wall biosynthesis